MGDLVVHLPPHIANWVLFIYFSRFSMDRYGRRIAQSCRYFKNNVDHFQNKIFIIKPIFLLNKAIIDISDIHPYQIKCTEHDYPPNEISTKIILVVSNKMV